MLLRTLPQQSPVHRLWAGTKMICLGVLVLSALAFAGWVAGIVCALLAVLMAAFARVPRSAVPRVPPWVVLLLLVTAAFSLVGSGLALYIQTLLISIGLLAVSLIIGWTTPLTEIAPAIVVLTRPLRMLRLPVNEWAVIAALCIRTLPLLLDEFRILLAARRLRRSFGIAQLPDLLTAVLAVSLRRAAEVGSAMTVRGGVPVLPYVRPALGRGDVCAFAVTAVGAALMCAGSLLLPLVQ